MIFCNENIQKNVPLTDIIMSNFQTSTIFKAYYIRKFKSYLVEE